MHPHERSGHVMSSFLYHSTNSLKEEILLFGGHSNPCGACDRDFDGYGENEIYNDLWKFDVSTSTWTQVWPLCLSRILVVGI